MSYVEVAQALANIGVLDVILPFILVFTLTYGVLRKTEVLGENKNILALISFVFGFFAILATHVLEILNTLASYLVLIPIILLFMGLVLGISGIETKNNKFLFGVGLILFALFTMTALVQNGVLDWQRLVKFLLVPFIILGAAFIGVYVALGGNTKKEENKDDKKPGPKPPDPDYPEIPSRPR